MREWTREERYRVLKDASEIRDLHEKIIKSKYRQTYHVQPITGLSSDPNGFAMHQGTWHLCYQWCPWGAVHGLKYWYHVTSKDLINWTNEGVGLWPDRDYDNKGTHSGSGISNGDELYFFYTGNHRDDNWVRTPYTCAARLNEKGKLIKLDKPLFGPRIDYSEHQRDPKIVYNEEKNKYYILIGAQTQDQRGCVLIYQSEKLLSGWSFAGELKVPGYENFGGMWECPYIVNISGKDVLIFSPQYTTLPGRGESTNHNVYLIGKMDYDTLTFTPESDYHYLDFGFDFYAAQGAANVDDPDKAILISWIGLPDNHYPTEEEDWEGSMSLPRELRIKDGKLRITPVSGIEALRNGEVNTDTDVAMASNANADADANAKAKSGGVLPRACEVLIDFQNIVNDGSKEDFDFKIFCKPDGEGGMKFHYNSDTKTLTIDKRGMDKRYNQSVGEVLDMPLDSGLNTLRIFIDSSSIEIFANDGEATFTSHVYPNDNEHGYSIPDGAKIKIWNIKPSVKEEFVV